MNDTELKRNTFRLSPQRTANCSYCGNPIIIPGYTRCLKCVAQSRQNGENLPTGVRPIGLKWPEDIRNRSNQ